MRIPVKYKTWVLGLLLLPSLLARQVYGQTASDSSLDYDQVLLNYEQDLSRFWANLNDAYQDSRKPEALAARAPLAERITNGEIMFLLNSYSEAALLLSDLLEEARRNDPVNLPKVLYYLGEANYQIKNYTLAQKYFGELVELKNAKYSLDALKRVIQIGDAKGELEHIDHYVSLLAEVSNGAIPLEVAYVYAKSLLRQKQPRKVIEILSPMSFASLEGVKAEYFLAVALVMDGQFQPAIERFQKVAVRALEWKANPKLTPEELNDLQEIADLSYLSIGRIYYEIGDYTAAIDSYQNISRHSKQFEQMLYDITWTYVRQAQEGDISDKERENNYRRALSILDLLLGTDDKTALAAEARLLQGNLLLRMNDEEEAEQKFQEITNRYGKIIDNINTITKGYSTPKEYFNQVLSTRPEGALGWENIMPPEVAIWAGENKDITLAIDTLHEVDRSRQWIDEGNRLMDTMLETIETENRMQFLPELSRIQKQQVQMKAEFIGLSEKIASLQRNIILTRVNPATQEALARARAERKQLEEEYKKIPQNAEAYDKRKELISNSIDATEKNSYKLGIEILSLVKQLDAMEQWFNTNQEQLKLSEQEAKEIRDRVIDERKAIQELDDIQKSLNNKLNKDRMLMKFLTEEEQRDQLVRDRYLKAVNYESDLLKKANEDIIQGHDGREIYDLIVKKIQEMGKGSRNWQDACNRLFVMVAFSKDRLDRVDGSIALQKEQIASELKWANPKNSAEKALPPVYQKYLQKIAALQKQLTDLETMRHNMEADYQQQLAMLEKLTGHKVTTQELLEFKDKTVTNKSSVINEQAPALLLGRIILARSTAELGLKLLDLYMDRIYILVDQQTDNIKNEILAQKEIFNSYKMALGNLEDNSRDMLSEISAMAFSETSERFGSIVLRADVGLLDLAWNKKENRTKDITRQVEERNVKMELLRQEFGEIAEEEE